MIIRQCILFILLFIAASVQAAPSNNIANTPVSQRQYEGFKPKGINFDGLILHGETKLTHRFIDNIHYAPTQEKKDQASYFKQALILGSDWNNHGINALLEFETKQFHTFNNENENNFLFNFSRWVDLTKFVQCFGNTKIERNHEDRKALISDQTPNKPFSFINIDLHSGLQYARGKFKIASELLFSTLHFDNARELDNEANLAVRDDADRSNWGAQTRLSYDLSERLEPFILTSYKRQDYLRRKFNSNTGRYSGDNQDSNLMQIAAGVNGTLFGKIKGRAAIGLERQSYDQAGLSSETSHSLDIDLSWQATPLTTIGVGYLRQIEQENGLSSNYTKDRIHLSFDHELRRNLLLHGYAAFEKRDFDNNPREDELYEGRISSKYLFNEHLYLETEGVYIERDSTNNGDDYNHKALTISLGYHL